MANKRKAQDRPSQEPQPRTAPRKTRKDKGTIWLMPRDMTALLYILEMYALRFDQLQRLLARESEWEMKIPGLLDARTVWGIIKRWHAAGLVYYDRVMAYEPAWIWLTRKGIKYLQSNYKYWQPKRSGLDHFYYLTEIRMTFEADPEWSGAIWKSERALKAEQEWAGRGYARGHLPDAEVYHQGLVCAIELELNEKNRGRTRNIMTGLIRSRYDNVFYYAKEPVLGFLRHTYEALEALEGVYFTAADAERVHFEFADLEELFGHLLEHPGRPGRR
jgi:hypothetical protein